MDRVKFYFHILVYDTLWVYNILSQDIYVITKIISTKKIMQTSNLISIEIIFCSLERAKGKVITCTCTKK